MFKYIELSTFMLEGFNDHEGGDFMFTFIIDHAPD